MIRYPVAAALAVGGLLVTTACASSPGTGAASSPSPSTSASASPAPSQSAPAAADCGTATPKAGDLVTLTSGDNGEKLCVNLGTTVEVLLQGTPADKWKTIDSSSELVIAPKLEPGMNIPAGWTGAAFEAIRSGTAYVGSLKYPCGTATKGRNDMQCGVIVSFRVDITVASLRHRSRAGYWAGRVRRRRAPPPGGCSTVTQPPWACAIWRTIARPSPEPGTERSRVDR